MSAWLARHGRAGPWAPWLWAALCVFALRLVLGLVLAAAWVLVRPPALLDGGALQQAALNVWVRWDAVHYLALADVGYAGVSVGDTVFYPLYPVLVRAAAAALPLAGAGLLVSTLAAVAALAGVYVLAERHYGPEAGRWAATALAVYPTALFLVAPFTEALFLALTVWAFVAAEQGRWLRTGALAGLAALTRGPGLLTVPALAWLALRQWRAARGSQWALALRASLGLLLAAGGGLAFLVYRQARGWPPMGAVLRAYSGVELLDPVRGVAYAVAQVLRVPDVPTVLDMVSAVVFGVVLVLLARQARWRNGAWLIYFGLNLLFDLSKHSLTAAAWQSLARYVLVLFPAFVVAGAWLARQTQRVRFIYVTLSSAGLLIVSVLYVLWIFVG